MEIFALMLALGWAASVAGALWWWLRRRPTKATTAEAVLGLIDDEDEEKSVEERLAALERNLRMLTGRLNKVSPPRLGTGAGNGEAAPKPTTENRPMTRTELFAEMQRRGRA